MPAPPPPAADTAHARAPGDTVPPDSALAKKDTTVKDTVPHYLPVMPTTVPSGSLPRGDRYVFPHDSIVFSNIVTLSDLLDHIPGVFVARGGFYGAAEPVIYAGRGPAALEVYLDGVPYLPVGRDSVWLDPARIPLGPMERVEVQVLPGSLRVYLVTTRQRSTFATSEVDVKTGQFSTTGYRGGFAKRWLSGFGLSVGADYNNTNGDPGNTSTPFNSVDLWLKGEYIPSPHYGATYELIASSWDRSPQTQGVVDPALATHHWKQKRSDALFRAFYATRDDGLGFRVQTALSATTVSGDTALEVDRSMWQDQFDVSETMPTAALGLTATISDRDWPLRFDGRASWLPLPWITLAADARHSAYNGRHGTRAHGSAGITLPLGFSLRGDAAWARDLQAPTLAQDSLQTTVDYSGAVRWDSKFASLEFGGARLDPFKPIGFELGVPAVTSLPPTPQTTVATFQASVRPYPGFTLSGWYYQPRTGGGAFMPPTHGRYSLTFDSKFWRVFRSGIFRLRAEYAAESWSRSPLGGIDAGGQQPVHGAAFTETNLEMQIAGVVVFWQIRNNNYMRSQYVVGTNYPKNAQVYGVRWTFNN